MNGQECPTSMQSSVPVSKLDMEARIAKAERSLAKGNQVKTLASHSKPVLMAMCEARGIDSTGVKVVLALRLVTWVIIHLLQPRAPLFKPIC